MRGPRAVVLVCLLVTAGCLGVGGDATDPSTGAGENLTATVVDVVDGDTLDVRYEDGATDTVRLLGVDTPEVRGDNDPTEYEGVPDTEAGATCLREAGAEATDALAGRVADERVRLVVDPAADRRDRFGRLLAYVEREGVDLNRWLVAEGHARVYDSTFARSVAYYDAESAAQREGAALWRCRSPETETTEPTGNSSLVVATVHADAAGDDHENLDDEYVVFENAGETPLNLSGWRVRDEAGHSYAFPEVSLAPGESVTLYSGRGTDGDGRLYWGRDSAVWNNGGDTVIVSDAEGQVVLRHAY